MVSSFLFLFQRWSPPEFHVIGLNGELIRDTEELIEQILEFAFILLGLYSKVTT